MKKLLILVFVLALVPVFANAETIVLIDGTVIKGEITRQTDTELTVETIYGSQTIRKQFVHLIQFDHQLPVYGRTNVPQAAPPSIAQQPPAPPAPPVPQSPPPAAPATPAPVQNDITPVEVTPQVQSPPPVANPAPAPIVQPMAPSTVQPTSPSYYYEDEDGEDFFTLSFATAVFGIKSDYDSQALPLLGISMKWFEWGSLLSLGMFIMGNDEIEYNNYGTIEDFYSYDSYFAGYENRLDWSTIGFTANLRVPSSYVSPYIGMGFNVNVFKQVIYDAYLEEKIDEYEGEALTKVGFHFDLGTEFYIAKIINLDVGFRGYYLAGTEETYYEGFKFFGGGYINLGINF